MGPLCLQLNYILWGLRRKETRRKILRRHPVPGIVSPSIPQLPRLGQRGTAVTARCLAVAYPEHKMTDRLEVPGTAECPQRSYRRSLYDAMYLQSNRGAGFALRGVGIQLPTFVGSLVQGG